MLYNKILVLALSVFLLQGCVFIPLYYKSTAVPSNFDVAPIADRRGQILRNLLREKLRFIPPNSASCYYVTTKLSTSQESAGYNTDLTTTITRVHLKAEVSLSDDMAKVIDNFNVEVADFYINAISTYATTKAEEDVERRLLNTLADGIVKKISVALKVPHAGRP